MQGSAIRRDAGLVNFVAAVAYHFCLALPAAFTQLVTRLLVEPCGRVETRAATLIEAIDLAKRESESERGSVRRPGSIRQCLSPTAPRSPPIR